MLPMDPQGSSEALFVSAKYHSQRFEFIFTSLATNASQLFSVVQAVNTAYNTSRLYRELKLRDGCPEDPVEDTKGNNGNQGLLQVTSLRLTWWSKKTKHGSPHATCHMLPMDPQGSSEALFVSAKYHSQRFEFIFTSLATNASQLFSVVQAVSTAYNTSRLYRELKLRGALIADRELRLLPQEQTYSRVNGVWNLSSEQ
ncbi:BBS5 protein, partial [Haematococcus lacustris]